MSAQLNTLSIKLIKGMNLDLGVQTFSPNTAYKLVNIKNLMSGSAILDSLSNEKGTSIISLQFNIAKNKDKESNLDISTIFYNYKIISAFKCTSLISVIFMKDNDSTNNCIFKVYQESENSTIYVTLLAFGTFNFGDYIDAVFCYENSEIQKVYWVDGVNVLRYINLNKKEDDTSYIIDSFYIDSTPEIRYDHLIRVHKKYTQGLFSAGVIQYAFTYYIENGPETPIVDYTPLYYITNESRGLKADETVMCCFEVEIINPDPRFDYIRLYAILRTSLNGTPITRIVKDIKINKDE